jgi:phospholipid-translocating ATPase
MTREEYNEAAKKLDAARRQVNNRKDEVIKAEISIEQKLVLMGATAVEDKLQDGVVETIRDLKKAGIKIWVLTGDKLETAVSVATSCGLLSNEDMERMVLARQPNPDSCGEVISRFITALELDHQTASHNVMSKCLIVDGRSLHLAMKHHLTKFNKLCSKCAVVVCCRMSPIQKAEVVRMVKMSRACPVTAAIGDGANDVSMIQEAHVGFGLMGREGRQAVNAADFAFSRFRFLKPVLLVHGAYFYHRVSNLIHFFFYKNVVFVTPQVIFSFYNVFSSQTLYHGLLVSFTCSSFRQLILINDVLVSFVLS